MKGNVWVGLLYAGLIAAFAAITAWIPYESSPVFIVAFASTVAMFAVVAVTVIWRSRGQARHGWPDEFTMLIIQLVLYAFLYAGSLFCPLSAAVIMETVVWLLTAAMIAGDQRLQNGAQWVVLHWRALLCAAGVLIVAIFALRAAAPLVRYRLAVSLLNRGRYEEAARAFDALDDYEDAAEQAAQARFQWAQALNGSGEAEEAYALLSGMLEDDGVQAYVDGDEALAALREKYAPYDVGNIVVLGAYQGTPLTWRVLAQQGNRRLLLTEDIVTRMPYNEAFDIVYWETCSLRAWLNETFYNEAFADAERALILETAVANDDNVEYRTDAGNDTVDRIFLLSLSEAEAIHEAHLSWLKASEAWWLRSPGCSRVDAVVVYDSGGLNKIGSNVDTDRYGVRPAIWIDLTEIP